MSNNRFRDYAHTMLGQLPTRTAHDFFKNLKANWYFPLSALAFFWPQVQWLVEPEIWHISLAITFICMLFISGQLPNLWNETRAHGWFVQMWTLLSACGILLRSQRFAYDALAGNASFQALVADSSANMARFVSVALALGGFLFIYICLCWFWTRLGEMLRDCLLFSKLTRWEWALYSLLALAEILCMARIFFATTAFYTNDPSGYDIIYTSDSGALVNNMGYLFITFPENDLRQPLFALFAAPFLGAPYFLGQILQLSPTSQAILVDAVQIVMLVLANLLLTRLLDLKPLERAALMLITSFTYAQMLGVLMMEQYIVAYFWLALTLALLAANREAISSNITGGDINRIISPFTALAAPCSPVFSGHRSILPIHHSVIFANGFSTCSNVALASSRCFSFSVATMFLQPSSTRSNHSINIPAKPFRSAAASNNTQPSSTTFFSRQPPAPDSPAQNQPPTFPGCSPPWSSSISSDSSSLPSRS